ncbi:MAG: M36 family metallopeptidase [Verrucomicrobiia bacterium]
MKRRLFRIVAAVAAAIIGLEATSSGFIKPDKPQIGDFDIRQKNVPAAPTVSPEKVSELKKSVSDLQVKFDSLLGSPAYFYSRSGFLTTGGGKGGVVRSSFIAEISANDKNAVVKAFLNEHSGLLGYDSSALDTAIVLRDYVDTHNGLRTVIWQQTFKNIPIFEAITKAHITKNGDLVNIFTLFVKNPEDAAGAGLKNYEQVLQNPIITAEGAIVKAAIDVGEDAANINGINLFSQPVGFDKRQKLTAPQFLKGEADARLVWFPINDSTLRLSWQTIIVGKKSNQMFLHIIDAENGKTLVRRNLTSNISDVSYRVYVKESPSPFTPGHPVPMTNQPPYVARMLVITAAANTNASPNGWINDADNETLGNNVDAHLDWNDDDQPDLPRPQGNPFRVFDFPIDFTQHPTNYAQASVVQAFYYLNWYHDKLYEYGFTEAAGNFQQINFGRGGFEGDPVIADVQDGGGFNDAFMMTPPDGIPARMTMWLFNGPQPMRDSAFDGEIILHEYTHGLSTRLVGGGVGIWALQTRGMGEGWSDFYPLAIFSEPTDRIDGTYPIGGYITFLMNSNFMENYYFGIRRYPYSTDMNKNPLTFKDIDPTQASMHPGIPMSPIYSNYQPIFADDVHFQGEFWCSVLWELRANLIKKHGFAIGNNLILQIVTDAMKLSPPNPTYIEERDAIILADQVDTGGDNYNELWAGFAKRGLGGAATAPNNYTTVGISESFEVPGLTMVNYIIDDSVAGNNNGTVDPNECVEMNIFVKNANTIPLGNIVATLSTTNTNVFVVEPVSTYQNIPPFDSALNRTPFRFYVTPNFPCGSSIPFMLVLQSQTQSWTNYFLVRSGFISLLPSSFSNNTAYAIPDNDPFGVSSPITVSGIYGAIGKVTVSLHITHSYMGDLTIDLISPDGTVVKLADKRGGLGTGYGVDCSDTGRTVFDDRALTPIGSGRAPFVGTFRPELPLSAFGGKSGTNVNGIWRLRVVDTTAQDTGNLLCWSLNIYPTTCTDGGGDCAGDLTLTATASPSPVLIGSNLTYTLYVQNRRTVPASSVVLTNFVPTNVNLVSFSASQGISYFTNGLLVFELGTISDRFPAVINITVQPLQTGVLTNSFYVYSPAGDRNPIDNSAVVSIPVVLPMPIIEIASAQLLSESYLPPSLGIEAGETVTVQFNLRNVGIVPSTNLIVYLLSTNGILTGTTPQNYGVIEPFGTNIVSGSFTFTAIGNPGQSLDAVLRVYDGTQYLGDITYRFVLGSSGVFSNPSTIIINDANIATPYPSTIQVTGLVGVISKIGVTLSKLTHSYPDDIDVMLVSPTGQKIMLMSDAGGGSALVNRTIKFSSGSFTPVPDEAPIDVVEYAPANYQPDEVFPAPAPSYGVALATFNPLIGINPNGLWQLFVIDDTATDSGAINGGWSLTINTVSPVESNANLSVNISQAPTSPVISSTITYTMFITNYGLDQAGNVVLTNQLPLNMRFKAASVSQGSFTNYDRTVVFNIGNLAVGSNAVATVEAVATMTGQFTVGANVSSSEIDINTNNNYAQITTVVAPPNCDVAVKVNVPAEVIPFGQRRSLAITVTNGGPNIAPAVVLTNILPQFVSISGVSLTSGVLTNRNGVVVWEVGDIEALSYATLAITLSGDSLGSAIARFIATSAGNDLNLANNDAIVGIEVVPPRASILNAGANIITESFSLPNGSIDPGETVTLNVALRNNGTAPTTNLTVSLMETNGVILSAGPQIQNYGAIIPEGAPVIRQFTFTVAENVSGQINLVFRLEDDGNYIGNIVLTLPASTIYSFANNGQIIIPQSGQASPYPSVIIVSNVPAGVDRVTVSINGFSHSFVSDIDVLLVGPGGQKVILMSDVGEGANVENVNLTFDDSALTKLPAAFGVTSGAYRPSNYDNQDVFNPPAPAAPYAETMSSLLESNLNGTWSLYVMDDSGGDAGRIGTGWSIKFYKSNALPPVADIAVFGYAPSEPVKLGSNVVLTLLATNYGPSDATGVVLTNRLPSGFYLESIQPSQGSVNRVGDIVTWNIGNLAASSVATLRITGTPISSGEYTNQFTAIGVESDANLMNNSGSIAFIVEQPQLRVLKSGQNIILSWPSFAVGYVLEWSSSVDADAAWKPVDEPATAADGVNYVVIDVSAIADGQRYFRLRK